MDPSETHAQALDAADPLAAFRGRFYLPPGAIYLDGNSLGLLSRDAEQAVEAALASWKRLGIDGWLGADPPWFTIGEELGARMAALMGAEPGNVVVTGGTTINLHALVATFYRPDGNRRKILATALDFPSDIYALASEIRLHGGDEGADLVLAPSADGATIDEDAIVAAMTEEVALALLPAVLYRSGQLLDIATLTTTAHAHGIVVGFDCAHSAGAVPHALDRAGVDFATWCTYKYLNGGPGAIGALYVNSKHHGTRPALAGWWGYDKTQQFDMRFDWRGANNAGAWQIGTPSILSAAPLLGSLRIFAEAGIERVRAKSLALTSYLIDLLEHEGLTAAPYDYAIATPRDPHRRGGHVAVAHPAGPRVAKALKRRGVIPDFRPPDIIRLAPIALYTSFHDLWRTVQLMRAVIDDGDLLAVSEGRELVA